MPTETAHSDFKIVANVKIPLRVELDQRILSFPELLHLEQGSVLRLNRPTGENVDIFAGEVLIGTGEILVIDGKLVVRVADLREKAPADR